MSAPEDDAAIPNSHRRGGDRTNPGAVRKRFLRKPEESDGLRDEDAARAFVPSSADLDHSVRENATSPSPPTDLNHTTILPGDNAGSRPGQTGNPPGAVPTDVDVQTLRQQLAEAHDALVVVYEEQRVAQVARTRAERETATARDELFDLQQAHDRAQDEVSELEGAVQARDSAAEALSADLDRVYFEGQASLDEARSRYEEVTEELARAQAELTRLTGEALAGTQPVEEASTRAAALETELAERQGELRDAHELVDRQSSVHAELDVSLEQLTVDSDDADAETGDRQQRISELETELARAREQIASIETAQTEMSTGAGLARQYLETRLTTALGELTATRARADQAAADLVTAGEESAVTQAQLAEKTSRVRSATVDLDATRMVLKTSQGETARLNDALGTSREEVAALQAKLAEAEAEDLRGGLTHDLDIARAALKSARAEVTSSHEKVAEVEARNAALEQEAAELRRTAARSEPQMAALQQEYDAEMAEQRATFSKRIETSESARTHAEVEARILAEQLRRSRERSTDLELELAKIATGAASAEEGVEARRAAEHHAAEQLERAEVATQRVEELTARVADLEASLSSAESTTTGHESDDPTARVRDLELLVETSNQARDEALAAARVAEESAVVASQDATAEIAELSGRLDRALAELSTAPSDSPEDSTEASLVASRDLAELAAREADQARIAAVGEAEKLRALLEQAYAALEAAGADADVQPLASVTTYDRPDALYDTSERLGPRDWLLDPLEEFPVPAPTPVEAEPYFPTIFDDDEEHGPGPDPLLEDEEYARLVAAFDSAMVSTKAMVGSVAPVPARDPEVPPEEGPELWAAEWYGEAEPDPIEEAADHGHADTEGEPEPVLPAPVSLPARMLASTPAAGPSDGSYHTDSVVERTSKVLAVVAVLGGIGIVILAVTGNLLTSYGIVLSVLVAAAVVLAVRMNTARNSVEIVRGAMNVVLGERHHTFYLNRDSTHLQMTGEPGDRDWKVEVLRKGMAPVLIDRRSVDPQRFTAALRVWRPDL